MSEARPALQPIDGMIIRRSVDKTLALIGLFILCYPLGFLLIWIKIRNVLFDEFPADTKITLYGFFLGIAIVVGLPFLIYDHARSLWVGRRMVIGNDRLQIQERHGGIYVAVLQIPFANIAQVQYEVTKTDRQVAIDFKDPEDPDTQGENHGFPANAETGHNYCITEAFRAGPSKIAAEIQGAMKLWAATLPPEQINSPNVREQQGGKQ